jgi:xylulokinase
MSRGAPAVLGVDCSTQATKVEVRELESGRLLGSGRAPHPVTFPPRSEQDPRAWWDALRAACAGVDRSAVVAMAVAGQQHGLVALDPGGRVLRPAKLWNDTESAPQARSLVEALGTRGWAEACGSVPVASFTVTKLAWMREHEPDRFVRLGAVLLPHDWMTFQLTGERVTDRGDASGTGYWSPAGERWRPDLLALVDPATDWEPVLPRVLGPADTAGTLRDDAALDLGLAGGIPVAAGTGDNMAAALGLGLRPGETCVSIGTSGTVFAVSDTAVADAGGTVAGFADATGRFLPLVCTLNGTRVTDLVARWLGRSPAGIDALALEAAPGCRGLTLLPYLDGERTPDLPLARGLLDGIRSDTSAAELARAAVEGVVCGLLEAWDALRRSGASAGEGALLLAGGGSASDAYRRILATLSGRPVRVPAPAEHVAAGACVQAAACHSGESPAGVAARWRAARDPETEIAPDPGVDAAAVRAAHARLRDRAVAEARYA